MVGFDIQRTLEVWRTSDIQKYRMSKEHRMIKGVPDIKKYRMFKEHRTSKERLEVQKYRMSQKHRMSKERQSSKEHVT